MTPAKRKLTMEQYIRAKMGAVLQTQPKDGSPFQLRMAIGELAWRRLMQEANGEIANYLQNPAQSTWATIIARNGAPRLRWSKTFCGMIVEQMLEGEFDVFIDVVRPEERTTV